MILNQDFIRGSNMTINATGENNTFVARAGLKALGGKFGIAYDYTDFDWDGDYSELDVTYKTKVFNDSTTLFAGYVYQDFSDWDDARNLFRVWGRYNF